jgi:hypothetical protein
MLSFIFVIVHVVPLRRCKYMQVFFMAYLYLCCCWRPKYRKSCTFLWMPKHEANLDIIKDWFLHNKGIGNHSSLLFFNLNIWLSNDLTVRTWWIQVITDRHRQNYIWVLVYFLFLLCFIAWQNYAVLLWNMVPMVAGLHRFHCIMFTSYLCRFVHSSYSQIDGIFLAVLNFCDP